MYCSKCGKELEKTQIYCSFCGTKCSDVIYSNSTNVNEDYKPKITQEDKENIKTSAGMIRRAYIVLCCVSISLTFFWNSIIQDSEFEEYVGVFGFIEFALIFMSIFILSLNKRYQYNAAKVVILFSIFSAGEVLFLLMNIENPEASMVVEIIFSLLIFLIYFLLENEIQKMLANENNNEKKMELEKLYNQGLITEEEYANGLKEMEKINNGQ